MQHSSAQQVGKSGSSESINEKVSSSWPYEKFTYDLGLAHFSVFFQSSGLAVALKFGESFHKG